MDTTSRDQVKLKLSTQSTSDKEEELTGNCNRYIKAKQIIATALPNLVRYMEPDPIFHCAVDFFGIKEMRDMREQRNASEKTTSLCKKLSRSGRLGYDKLKEWLRMTDQVEVLEMLQCIEDGKDFTRLLETLHEKTRKKMENEKQKDKPYAELRLDFQFDLISFYKHKHRSILLSPLIDEDQSLLKFYEIPDVQSVDDTRYWDVDKQRYIQSKTKVKSLHDIFHKENKLCRNIYLTADAGHGKTAFCKKLALAWCQAKKPNESEKRHFSKDEITTMGGFSFVFLISLRDSSCECDIDMLIFNQICSQLMPNHKYKEQFLATILREERCLVLLDGLDQWTHPLNSCREGEKKVPHQSVRENVAVLTTTRPWKLSAVDLHSSPKDQLLELEGLSDDSAQKLKRSVISHLYGEENQEKINKYEMDFNKTVRGSHKSDVKAIPLFLMYLIFLWFYNFKVGKSLAELYSSFIELLLYRTVSKEGVNIPKTETVDRNIPPCFNEKKLCKQFYTLLTTLGKLAFYTLFSEKKEDTLVFDGCEAKEYLSKEEFTFCLKAGIINESNVQGSISLQQKTKLSFAHKTMQEFLAALYISSANDQSSVQDTVLSKCKCVKDILDMSKMLIFIVSISAKFSFSRELMKIVNEDEITQEYRRSLQCGYDHPLKDLQDMYISCCKEIPHVNEVNLCLQDVFIAMSCMQREYRENLKRLTMRNKQTIRSVNIDMFDIKYTFYSTEKDVTDNFSLTDLANIEKIYFSWVGHSDDVLPLLNSSVKSLYLCYEIDDVGLLNCWSRSLFDKVTSLHLLEAIGVCDVKMSHSEWTLLLDFISQRDRLREIQLSDVSCSEHERSHCTGLDLSRVNSLRKLNIFAPGLSPVIINMASLKECGLRESYYPNQVWKFINLDDNKINNFSCCGLKSGDELVRMLRDSQHIRNIALSNVTMEASALEELVDSVLKLKHTVTVKISSCTISPREKFKTLKGKIKASPCFRILEDDDDVLLEFEEERGDEVSWFCFKTKTNGD